MPFTDISCLIYRFVIALIVENLPDTGRKGQLYDNTCMHA